MITYYKLWDKLNRANKRQKDLKEILSPATIAKLRKNETVTTETLDKLCEFFGCQPGDLIEYQTSSNTETNE